MRISDWSSDVCSSDLEIRNVVSYDSFRTKMRCLVEDHVVPVMKAGRPTLAVFNEDAGLMTIATGTRGALVRAQAQTPLGAPLGDAVPLGIVAALGLLNTAYLPQVLAYQTRDRQSTRLTSSH